MRLLWIYASFLLKWSKNFNELIVIIAGSCEQEFRRQRELRVEHRVCVVGGRGSLLVRGHGDGARRAKGRKTGKAEHTARRARYVNVINKSIVSMNEQICHIMYLQHVG